MRVFFIGGAADAYKSPLVIFSNIVTAGNITSSSTVAGTDRLNILTDDTFSGWSPIKATPAWIGFKATKPLSGYCIAIGAHNLGSVGASIGVQAWNGSAWLEILPPFLVSENAPLIIFDDISANRYGLRVTIEWMSEDTDPFIGLLRIGKALQFPTDIAAGYTPANHARSVELYQSSSMGGQFFAPRIKRIGGSMSPPLNPIPRDFADNYLLQFRNHYDGGFPFFWAGNPSFMQDDVALARRAGGAGELRTSYRAGGLWADLSMEFEIHGA